MTTPEEPAEPGGAGIGVPGPARAVGLGVARHRPELRESKATPRETDPFLEKEDRPSDIQPDRRTDDRQQRQERGAAQASRGEVDEAMDEPGSGSEAIGVSERRQNQGAVQVPDRQALQKLLVRSVQGDDSKPSLPEREPSCEGPRGPMAPSGARNTSDTRRSAASRESSGAAITGAARGATGPLRGPASTNATIFLCGAVSRTSCASARAFVPTPTTATGTRWASLLDRCR